MTKKTGHVPATFTDAGTEQTFEGGKEHLIDAGSYANYEAAGLVHSPAPKAKATKAPKPRKPKAAKAAAVVPPVVDRSADEANPAT